MNGEITDTTPAGRRRASDQCGSSEASTWPFACVGSADASKHSCAATWASIPALGWMAPVSRTTQSTTSAACSSNNCPARRSTAARSVGLSAAQDCWADDAADAARYTSSGVAAPT